MMKKRGKGNQSNNNNIWEEGLIGRSRSHLHLADLYKAYHLVHNAAHSPFTTTSPQSLFQVCRYLLNEVGSSQPPKGISLLSTIYILAKEAKNLECYKLSQYCYDKLHHLRVPDEWVSLVEVDMMVLYSLPSTDNQIMTPTCFRCSRSTPFLTTNQDKGDVCSSCGHPFIRSFLSFQVLPLVEFVTEVFEKKMN